MNKIKLAILQSKGLIEYPDISNRGERIFGEKLFVHKQQPISQINLLNYNVIKTNVIIRSALDIKTHDTDPTTPDEIQGIDSILEEKVDTLLKKNNELKNELIKVRKDHEEIKQIFTNLSELFLSSKYGDKENYKNTHSDTRIKFKSRNELQKAFKVLFKEKHPFRIIGFNSLIVPNYVQDILRGYGSQFEELKLTRMSELSKKDYIHRYKEHNKQITEGSTILAERYSKKNK